MTELEHLLRDDLRRATADLAIEVDADALLAQHRAATRRRVAAGVALAATGLALGAVAWGALGGGTIPGVPRPQQPDPLTTPSAPALPTATPTGAGSASPTPRPSGSPSAAPPAAPGPATSAPSGRGVTPVAPAGTASVAVYFVDGSNTDHQGDPLLTRETRFVPKGTPVRGALEALLAGPSDAGLRGLWPRGVRVLGIAQAGGVITVDLSGEARDASVGAAAEVAMVQSLVWTVTSAYDQPDARVRLLIEGRPAGDAWGHMVWDAPIAREAALDALTPVIVDTPLPGATVGSPVVVTGEAAAFEATLEWRVIRAGVEVARGTAMTSEGQRFAPFRFTVDLPAGSCVLTVAPTDPSGGAAGPIPTAGRSFTVR